MAGEDLTFTLSLADIEPAILPEGARDPGTEPFRRAVVDFLRRQYEPAGGQTRIVFNDAGRTLEVRWTAPDALPSLEQKAVEALDRRHFGAAVPLLKALIAKAPDNPVHLYNLGVVYSDNGRLAEATDMLSQALTKAPDHINCLVALGVVHARAGDLNAAVNSLRHAVQLAPNNTFARQNLGACLLKQGCAEEATVQFRAGLHEDPESVHMRLGLAQSLEASGNLHDADEMYQVVIAMTPHGQVADLAKEGRTRIAHALMRKGEGERPDVVMYCLGALERFQPLTDQEIAGIGREIAILGIKGLDINDPARKYTLKSLPGRFSGLHLLSIMYSAFRQVDPAADVGIDLSQEYDQAIALFGGRR